LKDYFRSLDSSVGTVTGYGIDRPVLILGMASIFLPHNVQTEFEIHPASYPTGTEGDFPEGKAAGA
jgi:hypothetical protein